MMKKVNSSYKAYNFKHVEIKFDKQQIMSPEEIEFEKFMAKEQAQKEKNGKSERAPSPLT